MRTPLFKLRSVLAAAKSRAVTGAGSRAQVHERRRRDRQRGSTMLEGIVALAVCTCGMLGLIPLQSKMIQQGTNAQLRLQASYLAEEMIGLAAADTANVSCYQMTSSGPGSCGSSIAQTAAASWRARTLAALPGAATSPPTVSYVSDGTLTVTILWQRPNETMQHNYVSTTSLFPGS